LHELAERRRQRGHVAATHEQAVLTVADDAGHAARPVRQVRHAVGPRFQQHQAERIRAARQSKHIDAGEEIALLGVGQHAHTTNPLLRSEGRPEAAKVRHLRAGQDHRQRPAGAPQEFRGAEQIDAALFDALIRQTANDHLVGADAPRASGAVPVAASAFVGVHAQPLQNDAFGRHADVEQGGAFHDGLDEDAVGGAEQEPQRRGQIGAAGRVGRVAEVEERRQQERHAEPASQSQSAGDGKRIGKRGGMDSVEALVDAAAVVEHPGRDRIARQSEALPVTVGQ
jgi:hypothetical protein